MPYGDQPPEFYALPLGPSGLPDLMLFAMRFSHNRGTVPSDPQSTAYWSERFESDGSDALKWGLLFAKEKARQYAHAQRAGTPAALAPFELTPFVGWVTLSVQRRLGFYPMLDAAAAAAKPIAVAELLREKHTAYDVEVFEQHFQRA